MASAAQTAGLRLRALLPYAVAGASPENPRHTRKTHTSTHKYAIGWLRSTMLCTQSRPAGHAFCRHANWHAHTCSASYVSSKVLAAACVHAGNTGLNTHNHSSKYYYMPTTNTVTHASNKQHSCDGEGSAHAWVHCVLKRHCPFRVANPRSQHNQNQHSTTHQGTTQRMPPCHRRLPTFLLPHTKCQGVHYCVAAPTLQPTSHSHTLKLTGESGRQLCPAA